MNILDCQRCVYSKGNDVWSCDILDTESKGQHIKGDVLEHLDKGWKMMIAHPPCTHLANTGARWFTEGKKPLHLRKKALDFVRILMDAPIDYICIENPVGALSSRSKLGKATVYIQPYQFGHPEQKKTGLWLKGLPKLIGTKYIDVSGLPDKERQRLHWLPPSKDRWKIRSRTFQGIADAMADQWG